jgi:hypothetical protein
MERVEGWALKAFSSLTEGLKDSNMTWNPPALFAPTQAFLSWILSEGKYQCLHMSWLCSNLVSLLKGAAVHVFKKLAWEPSGFPS